MRQDPKYIQVKNLLLGRFREQEFQSGQQLPTEFELMDELLVSRTTIRQAIGELENAGVVERRHGSGTYFISLNPQDEEANAGLIGLVNFFLMDYIYPEIIRGIEDTIYEAGYSLVLSNCNQDSTKELESVRRLVDQGVKGLILEPSRSMQIRADHPLLRLLGDLDIPVVTTHWGISAESLSTVTIDDVRAGREAVNHLLNRGHKDIAIVTKEDVQAGYHRYQGFVEAMGDRGLEVRPEWVIPYTATDEILHPNQGYLCTQRLLDRSPTPPSAIFYFNDDVALQGYRAIRERGLRIPEDISVIGFDDFHSSSLVHPGLTTFRHPKYDLGKWAAKILMEEIETENRPKLPMKLIFEPILVERESVLDLR